MKKLIALLVVALVGGVVATSSLKKRVRDAEREAALWAEATKY